eukprot:353876-Chlamydomonas_euryale.AAC.4
MAPFPPSRLGARLGHAHPLQRMRGKVPTQPPLSSPARANEAFTSWIGDDKRVARYQSGGRKIQQGEGKGPGGGGLGGVLVPCAPVCMTRPLRLWGGRARQPPQTAGHGRLRRTLLCSRAAWRTAAAGWAAWRLVLPYGARRACACLPTKAQQCIPGGPSCRGFGARCMPLGEMPKAPDVPPADVRPASVCAVLIMLGGAGLCIAAVVMAHAAAAGARGAERGPRGGK